MKLTARLVEGLAKQIITAERFEWDDEIPGLGIRMRPGGSRNWVFQYKLGKKHRRMTLGALSAIAERETDLRPALPQQMADFSASPASA